MKKNKILYKIVEAEYLNDRGYPQYRNESRLLYGIPDVDETVSYITDYDELIKSIKSGDVHDFDLCVKRTLGGKEFVSEWSRWESYRLTRKNFTKYTWKRWIENCESYSLKQLKEELSAKDYIAWCKDNGIDITEKGIIEL